MRLFHLGIIFILIGFVFFALSAYTGEGGVALFLIFPVFYSSGIFGFLAILLIFLGFFLMFLSPFWSMQKMSRGEDVYYTPIENFEQKVDKKTEKRFGGVVLIGPIPIIFGSDKNMAITSILAAILFLIAIVFIFLIL